MGHSICDIIKAVYEYFLSGCVLPYLIFFNIWRDGDIIHVVEVWAGSQARAFL